MVLPAFKSVTTLEQIAAFQWNNLGILQEVKIKILVPGIMKHNDVKYT